MDEFRFADPEFTNFKPKTAARAVLRFRRLQKQGLIPWRYPECFIECAASLPEKELAKFESWIVNPAGEPDKNFMSVQEFQDLPVFTDLPVPKKPDSVSTHL
jgi:hypothetical protein